jgi:hypothetical protein
MRNKREAEPDFFSMTVDVMTYDTTSRNPPRVRPMNCRATPKRIYTPGGAVFDRQTGREILALEYRIGMTWKHKALPETLRRAQEIAP